MDDKLFQELSLELKGDYIFQKGTFLISREYGFLKMALYQIAERYYEVIIEKETTTISDVIQTFKKDIERDYRKSMREIKLGNYS